MRSTWVVTCQEVSCLIWCHSLCKVYYHSLIDTSSALEQLTRRADDAGDSPSLDIANTLGDEIVHTPWRAMLCTERGRQAIAPQTKCKYGTTRSHRVRPMVHAHGPSMHHVQIAGMIRVPSSVEFVKAPLSLHLSAVVFVHSRQSIPRPSGTCLLAPPFIVLYRPR